MRQRSWWNAFVEQIGPLEMYRKIFINESRLSVLNLSQTRTDTIVPLVLWSNRHHMNVCHSMSRTSRTITIIPQNVRLIKGLKTE